LLVLNKRAVELAMLVGAALHAGTNPKSVFSRKNYFYPDLPKNYQISQFDQPLCTGGYVEIPSGGERRRVGLIRVHLEEDAGKSIHLEEGGTRRTLLDFNRCGVPLVEIVTRPELRSPSGARDVLVTLKQILQYTGASSGNMEEGSMRCDVNVSLRRSGDTELGTRAEIKNLNSFRNVERALEYEIERQSGLLAKGATIAEETLLWDAGREKAVPMRSKEEAHDYRYFPEPDLLRLEIDSDWIARVASELPELPDAREKRFVESFELPAYDARVLCSARELAAYFEDVARLSGEPKLASNWIMTEVLRMVKEGGALRAVGEGKGENGAQESAGGAEAGVSDVSAGFPVSAANLAGLLRLVRSGGISGKMAKAVFAEMVKTGEAAEQVVSRTGLNQVTDAGQMRKIVVEVMLENPQSLSDYLRGREKSFGFLMGRIMVKTAGQANPGLANRVLRECLESARKGEAEK
jgi:aspartyl-tRNA(Asn)/glutamyl-tRNA(Gln) amidotransferase subunit B